MSAIIQINGDVTGPASAVDGQAAVFNGTSGKLLKALTTYRPSGVIYSLAQNVSNTGTTEQTLYTYTVPAGLLARDGDAIRVTTEMLGTAVAKTWRWKWGGVLIDQSAPGTAATTIGTQYIIRQNVNSQRVNHTHSNDDGTTRVTVVSTALQSANLANAIAVVLTGQTSGGAGQIIALSMMVEFLPAP